jgi:hypothetical protein
MLEFGVWGSRIGKWNNFGLSGSETVQFGASVAKSKGNLLPTTAEQKGNVPKDLHLEP